MTCYQSVLSARTASCIRSDSFTDRALTPGLTRDTNRRNYFPCLINLPLRLTVLIRSGLTRFKRRSCAERRFIRGAMGVIERLAQSWEDASFAVVAAIAWLSASLVSCPHIDVKSVSKAGVEIAAAMPSLGLIMVWIEDQEDDLEPSGPPGVRFVSPPSLAISQIMPPESVSLSLLTPAQHPLRC